MEPPLCLRGPCLPGRARGRPARHAGGTRLAQRTGEAGEGAQADKGRNRAVSCMATASPLAMQKGIASCTNSCISCIQRVRGPGRRIPKRAPGHYHRLKLYHHHGCWGRGRARRAAADRGWQGGLCVGNDFHGGDRVPGGWQHHLWGGGPSAYLQHRRAGLPRSQCYSGPQAGGCDLAGRPRRGAVCRRQRLDYLELLRERHRRGDRPPPNRARGSVLQGGGG